MPTINATNQDIIGGADAVVAVTGPAINANNENNRVVSAVLCSALYPNIVKVQCLLVKQS